MKNLMLACAVLVSLCACGGGGGGGTTAPPVVVAPPVVTPPVVTPPVVVAPPPGPSTLPLASLANICTDDGQKTWIRAHFDDAYLWYKEVVNTYPANYATPQAYFTSLLVTAKDRFSFTTPQATSDQYYAAGTEVGYGTNNINLDGRLRVYSVDPNSPAAQQKIARGAQFVGINGTPIGLISRDNQLLALYPSTPGQTNSFDILDVGASAPRTVTLTSTIVTIAPVPDTRVITTADNKKIGYLNFTDHILTAEAPLVAVMNQFKNANVDDVVLDMRYNGGGYLYIAETLASMLGGAKTRYKAFEKLQYNDKHPERNDRYDFLLYDTKGVGLPQLDLKRVFVLTSSRTCSASESVINSLTPFMDVIIIGGTTCGKPYGFLQTNNCGTAHYAIQFVGVNDKDEGNYTNGFAPTCSAADDLEHTLGDNSERMLSSALSYAKNGVCPAAVSSASRLGSSPAPGASADDAGATSTQVMPYRAPWRDIRVVR